MSAVERLVTRELVRGVPELDAIAGQLGISVRTLQRRLGELETSYQTLVDHVRRRCAERYLADDRLAIAEVSFLVGSPSRATSTARSGAGPVRPRPRIAPPGRPRASPPGIVTGTAR